MKDLNLVSREEQISFFRSFDHVFVDIDGVLWLSLDAIPGAPNAIKSLQKLGKTVGTLSNNTTKSIDSLHDALQSAGFTIEKTNITTPASAIISYLKEINFDRKLYVLGMGPLKKLLRESGFKLVDSECNHHVECVKDMAAATLAADNNVGAVISDVEFNLNYVALQKACDYLNEGDVLFLAGAPDFRIPVGQERAILGPGYFHKIIEDMTGLKPVVLAKPSQHLGRHLVDKFKIRDTSRVLVVGDSISEDMGTAASSGFKKLLVLSGLAKKKDVLDWTFPEGYKPDYYVDCLGTVHNIITRIFLN